MQWFLNSDNFQMAVAENFVICIIDSNDGISFNLWICVSMRKSFEVLLTFKS